MKKALLLIAPLALTACVTAQAAPPSANGVAYAKLKQTVRVGGSRVTPLNVIEDSRCPMNARCVWAGQVRLSIRVSTGRGSVVREIVSDKPLAAPGGTLTLASVRPDRRTDKVLRPSQYRFGFRLERGL